MLCSYPSSAECWVGGLLPSSCMRLPHALKPLLYCKSSVAQLPAPPAPGSLQPGWPPTPACTPLAAATAALAHPDAAAAAAAAQGLPVLLQQLPAGHGRSEWHGCCRAHSCPPQRIIHHVIQCNKHAHVGTAPAAAMGCGITDGAGKQSACAGCCQRSSASGRSVPDTDMQRRSREVKGRSRFLRADQSPSAGAGLPPAGLGVVHRELVPREAQHLTSESLRAPAWPIHGWMDVSVTTQLQTTLSSCGRKETRQQDEGRPTDKIQRELNRRACMRAETVAVVSWFSQSGLSTLHNSEAVTAPRHSN